MIMSYEDYVEEITVEGVEDLFDYITGRKNIPDLREDFIFRGIESSEYELIPSAFRDNGKSLDKYAKFDFNKNSLKLDEYLPDFTKQMIKERKALFNFSEITDRAGLKLPISQELRESIYNPDYTYVKGEDSSYIWPDYDFFEVISLAQHYGLPTCALDWSYDYRIALYFATKGILEKKNDDGDDDCVLWAFNYKAFELHRFSLNMFDFSIKNLVEMDGFPFVLYRPEYHNNPNLSAQKGLFTIFIQTADNHSIDPFDKLILNKVNELSKLKLGTGKNSNNHYIFKLEDKLFYKFIIPHDLKAKILNDLYKEGYTEERIFPGYASIAESIENRVKLDKLLGRK